MRVLTVIFAFLLISVQSFAASCYTPAQFRAEQAVRFHTQLMIVGMRCQRVLSPTAYSDYQKFTQRNQAVIHAEENVLIDYFRKNKMANAERAFNTLRTDMANRISMQANGKNFLPFCKYYANQLNQAKIMQPADFKRWIASVDPKQPVNASTRPLCAAAQRKQ